MYIYNTFVKGLRGRCRNVALKVWLGSDTYPAGRRLFGVVNFCHIKAGLTFVYCSVGRGTERLECLEILRV